MNLPNRKSVWPNSTHNELYKVSTKSLTNLFFLRKQISENISPLRKKWKHDIFIFLRAREKWLWVIQVLNIFLQLVLNNINKIFCQTKPCHRGSNKFSLVFLAKQTETTQSASSKQEQAINILSSSSIQKVKLRSSNYNNKKRTQPKIFPLFAEKDKKWNIKV